MEPKKKPKHKKTRRAILISKCDVLWRKCVKKRAGGLCEVSGLPGIDAHHLNGRNHSLFLRHRLENGMLLSKSEHFKFHYKESLTAWMKMMQDRPKDVVFLLENVRKDRVVTDEDLEETARRLEEELNEEN
jgi:hypothetical protein